MLKHIFFAILIAALFAGPIARGAEADGPGRDPLRTLRHAHPRVILAPDVLARVKQLLAQKDPDAVKLHESLQASARKILTQPPVEYVLIGPRLLDKSRKAFDRVTTLALLYQLDGNRADADRAVKELMAVCAFKDWHPPHFLDTAEMTAATALGYDWLYDVLTPEQRTTLVTAIRDKGLKAGLAGYDAKKPAFWTVCHHNWSQVCGGGLTLGALAIADEEPKIASDLLRRTYRTVGNGVEALGPDGGCPEGPGYWNYATSYTVYYLAALDTALGTDWRMSDAPGMADTGLFRIYTTGATLRTFNYADAHDGMGVSPQMFWMARRYDRPVYAAFERTVAKPKSSPFALIWLDTRGTFPPAGFPTGTIFKRVNVATFRSAWDDPNAAFIGFKGGSNRANHAHLDLGSFVFDADGHRWALDLGPDNYNLPAYFGKNRWTYYRLKTEGHNTLTIDGQNQNPSAAAPLVAYASTPGRSLAVADLSAAYAPHATRVQRGIELLDRKRVRVEDEIEAGKPVEVVWNFHTRATVKADGSTATLREGSAKLAARIVSPADAHFEVVSANAPEPQGQQPEVSNLTVKLPGKVKSARIVVLLEPVEDGKPAAAPGPVQPLSQWVAQNPLPAGPSHE